MTCRILADRVTIIVPPNPASSPSARGEKEKSHHAFGEYVPFRAN